MKRFQIYSYLINGVPINQVPFWTLAQLNGNPGYKFGESVNPPVGYSTQTSFPLWNILASNGQIKDSRLVEQPFDDEAIQNSISDLVTASGWNLMNQTDKEIAVQWWSVPSNLRDEVYSIDEQVKIKTLLDIKLEESRCCRWRAVWSELSTRLENPSNLGEFNIFNSTDITLPLIDLYIRYNVKGIQNGDLGGVFDYIDSPTFKNLPYVPSGMANMNQLSDRILNILTSGTYPM